MSDTEQPNSNESAEPKQTALRQSALQQQAALDPDRYCPNCGAPLIAEKCKVVCRSQVCVYRIVFNCSEF